MASGAAGARRTAESSRAPFHDSKQQCVRMAWISGRVDGSEEHPFWG